MSDATKLGIAQFVLAGAIALTGGVWALVTYVNEQARLRSDKAESLAVAERQAVSAMSRQLGLMDAYCPEEALMDLGEKLSPDRLEQACFDAYIEAQVLFFFTRTQMRKPQDVSEQQWNDLWTAFGDALEVAGDSIYVPSDLASVWDRIVNARGPKRIEPER